MGLTQAERAVLKDIELGRFGSFVNDQAAHFIHHGTPSIRLQHTLGAEDFLDNLCQSMGANRLSVSNAGFDWHLSARALHEPVPSSAVQVGIIKTFIFGSLTLRAQFALAKLVIQQEKKAVRRAWVRGAFAAAVIGTATTLPKGFDVVKTIVLCGGPALAAGATCGWCANRHSAHILSMTSREIVTTATRAAIAMPLRSLANSTLSMRLAPAQIEMDKYGLFVRADTKDKARELIDIATNKARSGPHGAGGRGFVVRLETDHPLFSHLQFEISALPKGEKAKIPHVDTPRKPPRNGVPKRAKEKQKGWQWGIPQPHVI